METRYYTLIISVFAILGYYICGLQHNNDLPGEAHIWYTGINFAQPALTLHGFLATQFTIQEIQQLS